MNKTILLATAGMMLMLALGCVQGAAGGPAASPNASANATARTADATGLSPTDRLSASSGRLLEVNSLFLAQTRDAEAAAGELNFSLASELFGRSSASGRNLTILLDEVCRLKGKNCSVQVEGYANIAVCAGARGEFYRKMDSVMPAILLRLNCTRNVSDAKMSPLCKSNEADYRDKCAGLRTQAGLAEAICQPVMPQMNMRQAGELLCNEAG